MENVNENSNKENQLEKHAPKQSIQQAFKKFQKQKFYQLKLNKYLKNIQKDRTNPQFKNQLRQNFVETAKKYIGIPYSQKYHQPGDPLYDSPLFLDCCGFIRQCVFDLRQQFGFTLAKWNQSYQYALLPNNNLKLEDLKPGDLIFYSATYYNPKLKPFPFKMVHVEIYLGEGKSIGSRWQKGTIAVFDSYKFTSTMYYDIQYHYKSIDSWLEGKCQNHYPNYKWLDERANEWLSDKFSVFADPSLDDMHLITNSQPVEQVKKIMIGKGNNCKLIKEYFSDKQKYFIMPEKQQFSPHFYFKWVQSPGEIDFYSFDEGKQITNHISNIYIIATKLELLKTLQQYQLDRINHKKSIDLPIQSFLPKTYRLNIMSDEIQFLNDNSSGIWIYKPRNLNQGRGIRIISNIQSFKNTFIQSKKFYLGEFSLNNMLYYQPHLAQTITQNMQSPSQYSQLSHDGLIQHYIKPLLIGGRKFDIRCYMLINSSPSIAMFHPGYLRLTLEPYTEEDIENEEKLFIHLTNNCFQHKHKDYKIRKEETIGKWDKLKAQIGQPKMEKLLHQIKNILLTTYAAATKRLSHKKGTYQLLGVDILVDSQCKPYLLEVNTNPALFTETSTQAQVIPPVVTSCLDLVLGVFEQPNNQVKHSANAIKCGFELLYSQNQSYIYDEQNKEGQIIRIENESIYIDINGLEVRKKISQYGEEIKVGDKVTKHMNSLNK